MRVFLVLMLHLRVAKRPKKGIFRGKTYQKSAPFFFSCSWLAFKFFEDDAELTCTRAPPAGLGKHEHEMGASQKWAASAETTVTSHAVHAQYTWSASQCEQRDRG